MKHKFKIDDKVFFAGGLFGKITKILQETNNTLYQIFVETNCKTYFNFNNKYCLRYESELSPAPDKAPLYNIGDVLFRKDIGLKTRSLIENIAVHYDRLDRLEYTYDLFNLSETIRTYGVYESNFKTFHYIKEVELQVGDFVNVNTNNKKINAIITEKIDIYYKVWTGKEYLYGLTIENIEFISRNVLGNV